MRGGENTSAEGPATAPQNCNYTSNSGGLTGPGPATLGSTRWFSSICSSMPLWWPLLTIKTLLHLWVLLSKAGTIQELMVFAANAEAFGIFLPFAWSILIHFNSSNRLLALYHQPLWELDLSVTQPMLIEREMSGQRDSHWWKTGSLLHLLAFSKLLSKWKYSWLVKLKAEISSGPVS